MQMKQMSGTAWNAADYRRHRRRCSRSMATRSNSPANSSANSPLAAYPKRPLGRYKYLIDKALSAMSLLDFAFGRDFCGNFPCRQGILTLFGCRSRHRKRLGAEKFGGEVGESVYRLRRCYK